jgi:hypothetical protein
LNEVLKSKTVKCIANRSAADPVPLCQLGLRHMLTRSEDAGYDVCFEELIGLLC